MSLFDWMWMWIWTHTKEIKVNEDGCRYAYIFLSRDWVLDCQNSRGVLVEISLWKPGLALYWDKDNRFPKLIVRKRGNS